MAENGRWTAAVLILCIALQKSRTTNAVYLGRRDTNYMNLPYFFEAPVENIQPGASRFVYTPQQSYPVYTSIHKAAIPVIPQYGYDCTRSQHRFQAPVSKAVEELFYPLFTYPNFLRRKPTEEKTPQALRTNLFLTGREQATFLPYDAGYTTAAQNTFIRNSNRNEFMQHTADVLSRTHDRQQRHVTLSSPSVNRSNVPPTAVIMVENITYMFPSNDTSKFGDKKVKKTHRGKRSLEHAESRLTFDNWPIVRNKRAVIEPMRVSLMDTLNNRASLQIRPSRWDKTTDRGNMFTENPEKNDCTSTYCKKSSTENNLQLKTQEYLDKLKKDFEAIKSTIENQKQAALSKVAEAKAKFQKQNSLGTLDERLSKGVMQRTEQRLIGSKTNTNYNLLENKFYVPTNDEKNTNNGLKSKGMDFYDLEDDIMNSDKHRGTRNSNSNANTGITDGGSVVTKLLMNKIVEEPMLMKFIKDYLLRFVNVMTVRDKEIEDSINKYNDQNTGELGNQGESMPTRKVNVKRSDGTGGRSSASCDAPPHMCAHAADVINDKNSLRRLQKLKMKGVKNVDNVSFYKLPHDGSIRSKNTKEELDRCKCLETSPNENKYGINANTGMHPKTSSLGLNIKMSPFGRQKTNQGLTELKPSNDENNEKSYDAERDSRGSFLDDLKALMQEQHCDCPRAKSET